MVVEMMEEKKAIDIFIDASDSFLIKVSSMLDIASQKETIKVEEAKEFLDIIYKGAQYVKLMKEEKQSKKPDGTIKNGSRVDRFANEKREQ